MLGNHNEMGEVFLAEEHSKCICINDTSKQSCCSLLLNVRDSASENDHLKTSFLCVRGRAREDQAQFLTALLASLPPTSIYLSSLTIGFHTEVVGVVLITNKATQPIWEAIKHFKCVPRVSKITLTHQCRMVMYFI